MSSVLDDVLVGSPDVAVFPKSPWPSVEVDGLVVYGICSGDGGLVVNCHVDWEGSEGTKEGPCDFRSSRGDRFSVKATVEFKSSVDRLVVLGDVAFLVSDRCVGGSFDMPCAVGSQGGELAISPYHGAVGKNVWCGGGIFVDGCHVHVLKTGAGISAEGLGEFACVVVVVEGSVAFGFSDSRPVPSKKGVG